MKNLIGGAASVATLALLLTGAGAASATPNPRPYIRAPHVPSVDKHDSLKRVDSQLVRRDDLTGAGVRAPSHVPVVASW